MCEVAKSSLEVQMDMELGWMPLGPWTSAAQVLGRGARGRVCWPSWQPTQEAQRRCCWCKPVVRLGVEGGGSEVGRLDDGILCWPKTMFLVTGMDDWRLLLFVTWVLDMEG